MKLIYFDNQKATTTIDLKDVYYNDGSIIAFHDKTKDVTRVLVGLTAITYGFVTLVDQEVLPVYKTTDMDESIKKAIKAKHAVYQVFSLKELAELENLK